MLRPSFKYERKLWKRGFRWVAGADEVGRGALAGPVVAAAVVLVHNSVFPPKARLAKGGMIPDSIRIDDSKRLSPKMREKSSKWIKSNALAWGVGEVSVAVINKLGIGKATKMAFRKAIKMLNDKCLPAKASAKVGQMSNGKKSIDFLLIDAFYLPYTKGLRRKNQIAIIKGDQKSTSIAAASIIAKVYRDKLMIKLSRKYKKYGWEKNKGYGTRSHIHAIKRYGTTRLHRKDFCQRALN